MKRGFVVDSLPRTGSTSLARLLNCHPDIKCLVEPFHPRRYDGQYYRMALLAKSVEPVLDLIWQRWNGIKHVWVGLSGFPFPENPELNDDIVLAASHVIFLERRNLLRRYVSNMICSQLDFWIGTRQEYEARLEHIQLRELSTATALEEIKRDKMALERRLKLFQQHCVQVLHLRYEDMFGCGVTATKQWKIVNDVLTFLGFRNISENEFEDQWVPLLDRDIYQWASPEIYRMIPGIEQLDREVGSDETGWLF